MPFLSVAPTLMASSQLPGLDIKVVVTRRDSHDGAALIRLSNRLAVRGGTSALADEHVNDLGGVLVCGDTAHATASSPNNAVGNVESNPPQAPRTRTGTIFALGATPAMPSCVRDSAVSARHVGAVPVGGGRLPEPVKHWLSTVSCRRQSGQVAAVTIVGERRLRNKVVAGSTLAARSGGQ